MSPDDLLAAVESMTPADRTRIWRLLTGVESGSRVREPVVRQENQKLAGPCDLCHGSGMVDYSPPGSPDTYKCPCFQCDGNTGLPTVPASVREPVVQRAYCPRCFGTGMVDVATQPPGKCARCAGEGEIVVRDDDGEID